MTASGPPRAYRHPGETITMLACVGQVQAIVIDDRCVRWRCTDIRHSAVPEVRQHGALAFYVFDIVTGAITNKEEPERRRAA
jgi:hypothetical protein